MFAFNNLIRLNKEVHTQKALVAARRVEYLKQILLSFELNDPTSANYKELFDVFATSNKDIVPRMIEQIDSLVTISMQRMKEPNVERIKEEMQQMKEDILKPLRAMQITADMEGRRCRTFLIKKGFINLDKQLQQLIIEIEEEKDPQILLEYKITKATSDILRFGAKLRDMIKHHNSHRRSRNEERRAAHALSSSS
jgi:hypothetical protein